MRVVAGCVVLVGVMALFTSSPTCARIVRDFSHLDGIQHCTEIYVNAGRNQRKCHLDWFPHRLSLERMQNPERRQARLRPVKRPAKRLINEILRAKCAQWRSMGVSPLPEYCWRYQSGSTLSTRELERRYDLYAEAVSNSERRNDLQMAERSDSPHTFRRLALQ